MAAGKTATEAAIEKLQNNLMRLNAHIATLQPTNINELESAIVRRQTILNQQGNLLNTLAKFN